MNAEALRRHRVLALLIGCSLAFGLHAQTGDMTDPVGSIFGRAAPNTPIVIVNEKTGERHDFIVRPDGTYIARGLSIGNYRVSGIGGEGTETTEVRKNVRVSSDTATPVYLIPIPECGKAWRVCLDGSYTDFLYSAASDSPTYLPTNRLSEASAKRDITESVLLAPGSVRGDDWFGNFASFGGSSIAENRYTVNGINVTDPNNGYGFARVPFEGLAEIEVTSGGLDAWNGGGMGGVINLTPKRGTNDFHAGGSIYWSPEILRESDPDQFDGFGDRQANNSRDNGWEYTANLWASGPLVEDHLS